MAEKNSIPREEVLSMIDSFFDGFLTSPGEDPKALLEEVRRLLRLHVHVAMPGEDGGRWVNGLAEDWNGSSLRYEPAARD